MKNSLNLRGIYLATHFENAYQRWDIDRLLQYIRELSDMGANAIGFWFDQNEYKFADLDVPGSFTHGRLQRTCRLVEAAHDAGMRVIMMTIANGSYHDQVRPELQADTSGRSGLSFYPTQLCPSISEAAEICAANIADLLGRIPYVDYLVSFPYDQGGCDCPRCAPWSRTYVRLLRRTAEAAWEVRPDLAVMLSVWHMTEQEVREMLDEIPRVWDEKPPINGNQDSLDDNHGLNANQVRALPGGEDVEFYGFPEISMLMDSSDRRGSGDWGVFAANPVPRRLAGPMLEQRDNLSGFIAYSEGVYEDLNKWVILRLGLDLDDDLDNILAGYAARYLSTSVAEPFVRFVYRLEDNWRHLGSLDEARTNLDLAKRIESDLPDDNREGFRWRLLRLRAELDEIVARGRRDGRTAVEEELEDRLSRLRGIYCADEKLTSPAITCDHIVDRWIDID